MCRHCQPQSTGRLTSRRDGRNALSQHMTTMLAVLAQGVCQSRHRCAAVPAQVQLVPAQMCGRAASAQMRRSRRRCGQRAARSSHVIMKSPGKAVKGFKQQTIAVTNEGCLKIEKKWFSAAQCRCMNRATSALQLNGSCMISSYTPPESPKSIDAETAKWRSTYFTCIKSKGRWFMS